MIAQVAGLDGCVVGSAVAFRIGLHTLRFRSDDPRVEFFVHGSHQPFVVPTDTAADCELNWSIGPVTASPGEILRSAGTRWQLRCADSGDEEVVFNRDPEIPTLSMTFDPMLRSVRVIQAPRTTRPFLAYASEYPWAEFVTSRLLGRDGGILLHASAVVKNGGAYLFTGHSGAGKSTISELAEREGAEVLSDDRTIVTLEHGRALAWGTPWHGSFARAACGAAPVRSISLLRHASDDRLVALAPQRAWKELYVRLIMPCYSSTDIERTVDSLERLCTRVPVRELQFRPRSDAFRLVERAG